MLWLLLISVALVLAVLTSIVWPDPRHSFIVVLLDRIGGEQLDTGVQKNASPENSLDPAGRNAA